MRNEHFSLVDLVDGEAAFTRNLRQAIHPQIGKIGADQGARHRQVSPLIALDGGNLQQQAFLQIAVANARWL